jgi:hypothetical protein
VKPQQVGQALIGEDAQVGNPLFGTLISVMRIERIPHDPLVTDVAWGWLHAQHQREHVVPAREVVRRNERVAGRFQHTPDFLEEGIGVDEMLDDLVRVNYTEVRGLVRQSPARDHRSRLARLAPSLRAPGLRELHPVDLGRSDPVRQLHGEGAVVATEIEHAPTDPAWRQLEDPTLVLPLAGPKHAFEIPQAASCWRAALSPHAAGS